MLLSDLNRRADNLTLNISDIELSRDRILEAIHTRQVRNTNGSFSPLTDFEGIDVLGNIIEASILSPNPGYYGDMHNNGHTMIAYCHDPDHRYLVIIINSHYFLIF